MATSSTRKKYNLVFDRNIIKFKSIFKGKKLLPVVAILSKGTAEGGRVVCCLVAKINYRYLIISIIVYG